MNIDEDIREYVSRMNPTSLGQAAAMEQTLQKARDKERADHPTFSVTGKASSSTLTPEEALKLKELFMKRGLPSTPLPEDSGPRVSSITSPPWHSAPWQITSDGRQAVVPIEVLKALLNSVGGCVILDGSDLIASRGPQQQITVEEYKDPWKLVFRIHEVPE